MKAKFYSDTIFSIRKPTHEDTLTHIKGDKWVDWSCYKIYILKSNKNLGLYWRENEEEER